MKVKDCPACGYKLKEEEQDGEFCSKCLSHIQPAKAERNEEKIKKAISILRVNVNELPDEENKNLIGGLCNDCYMEYKCCRCYCKNSPGKCYELRDFIIKEAIKILKEE